MGRNSSRRLLLAALVAALVSAGIVGPQSERSLARARRPSIVLFLTDDQRWDTLWAMPHVRHLLADRGVTFTNSFVVDPLCCPSRASSLTGNYAHTTRVYSNNGFKVFDDRITIATALHDAGYRTGFFGKYLNGYNRTDYIPPGWDRWFAFEGLGSGPNGSQGYYDYTVLDDGRLRAYGSAPREYSTSVLTRKAVRFVTGSSGPLFLYWAPRAPHLPVVPGPQDTDTFLSLKPFRPPSYDEADVSDKPTWVRELPRLSVERRYRIDGRRQNQYRSLVAVDRGVRKIVQALRDTGRLHNTMLVFTSDNGLAWGEHRWNYKIAPYEESIRVPMVVRYDPLTAQPRADSHLVANIDLAPTWAELAGAAPSGTDGISFMPLLKQQQTRWRSDLLIESGVRVHPPRDLVPKYCAVRSNRYAYVGYETGEEELYDLRRDPFQLRNRVRAQPLRSVRHHFRVRLRELCDPPPPGYVVQH